MQTSSPSYLLMASLDAARHQAVQQSTWVEPVQAAERIRDGLAKLPGISVLNSNDRACAGMHLEPYLPWVSSEDTVLSFSMCLTSACSVIDVIGTCSATSRSGRRAAWLTTTWCFLPRGFGDGCAEDYSGHQWPWPDWLAAGEGAEGRACSHS